MAGSVTLESPHNPRLAAARRLRRHPGDLLLAEGPQVVAEALRTGAAETVFVTEPALAEHAALLEGAPVQIVSERAMASLVETRAPQGVVAVARRPAIGLDAVVAGRPARVLVLTDVRDPGNVGTALRAAEGAGFDAAIVCAGSCDPANAKAVRASAGAVFHLRHADHVRAVDALEALAGWHRVGAVAGAAPLGDLAGRPLLAIVVGNEASGFGSEVAACLDAVTGIPMRGRLASLNAGVAAALLCYQTEPAP